MPRSAVLLGAHRRAVRRSRCRAVEGAEECPRRSGVRAERRQRARAAEADRQRQRGADIDEKLLKGALAYGEGRHRRSRASCSDGIEARTLDPSMAGHVAYVQGELAAKKEPAKALAHLDDARLLSPGTHRRGGCVAAPDRAAGGGRRRPIATRCWRRSICAAFPIRSTPAASASSLPRPSRSIPMRRAGPAGAPGEHAGRRGAGRAARGVSHDRQGGARQGQGGDGEVCRRERGAA